VVEAELKKAKLVDEIYRVKIRPMSTHERRDIADFLGLSYFTLQGKLSKTVQGNFTQLQRQKLKEWFGGKNGRGTKSVPAGDGETESTVIESSEVLSGERP
jgi:hypothetical protein